MKKKLVCLILAAIMLLLSCSAAFAETDASKIETLFFECNGQTIKTVNFVPLNDYTDDGNFRFGYVNLVEAFGEGAENWYAASIENSKTDSSIEQDLDKANNVFYLVTTKSTDLISRNATVHLYPKGIMPGDNTIELYDSKSGEPKEIANGNCSTNFTWTLGDIKNDKVDISKYLGESVKCGVTKVELWYGDSCKYTYTDMKIPAAELYENGSRALIKVYAIAAYKLPSVDSIGHINEAYIEYKGKLWVSKNGVNPFGVEYIPRDAEINLLDYFSDYARKAIEQEIKILEKNNSYYEIHVEFKNGWEQRDFNVDTNKLIQWLENKFMSQIYITICSPMSEGLFNVRFKVTSESGTYTGQPQGIKYTQSHPTYVTSIKYDTEDGSKPINAGTYHYKMRQVDTAYLPYYKEGEFTITKAIPENGIPFSTQRALYDGSPKTIDVDYLGLTDADIVYENVASGEKSSEVTEIGMYNAYIEVKGNDNIEDGTLILKNALQICESVTLHSITVTNGSANFSEEIKGEKITINANSPKTGKRFDHWECSSNNVEFENANSSKTTFIMPDEDVKIKAIYSDIQYKITVEGGSAGAETAIAKSEITIRADEISGKKFTGWVLVSGDASIEAPTSKSTKVKLEYSDVVIRAKFEDVSEQVEHSIYVALGTASKNKAFAGEVITVEYIPSYERDMLFSNWACSKGNVVFADPTKRTTTFIMPNTDVSVRANEMLVWSGSAFGKGSIAVCTIAGIAVIGGAIYIYSKIHKKK